MKFFKENSYDIVKLFIYQMGITIFSLVLYTAASAVEDVALKLKLRIILSVFATLFYFALVYTATWEMGAKDIIRVEGGKAKRFGAKGVVVSLTSGLPSILLALGALILVSIHLSNGSDAMYSGFAVCNLFLRFISAMFLGIIEGIFGSPIETVDYLRHSVGFLVAPLVTAAVAQLGYTLGEKNIKLLSGFSGKKKS